LIYFFLSALPLPIQHTYTDCPSTGAVSNTFGIYAFFFPSTENSRFFQGCVLLGRFIKGREQRY